MSQITPVPKTLQRGRSRRLIVPLSTPVLRDPHVLEAVESPVFERLRSPIETLVREKPLETDTRNDGRDGTQPGDTQKEGPLPPGRTKLTNRDDKTHEMVPPSCHVYKITFLYGGPLPRDYYRV